MNRSSISWRLRAGVVALGAGLAAAVLAQPAAGVASGTAPTACPTSALRAWWGMPGDGTAGSTYYQLELTNTSSSTCTLTGYPGVSAVNSSGRQVGRSAGWESGFARSRVTLTPGATSHALLRVVDVGVIPPASCRPVQAAGLRVYPPNQRTSVVVPLSVRACSATGPTFLTVRPVRALTGVPGVSQ